MDALKNEIREIENASAGTSSVHICHLTVLNPALHTRIFFKAAQAQQNAGYRVSIIGQDAAATPYSQNGIAILPTGNFSRLSIARLRAPARIARMAIATQAHIFQIHAPELLSQVPTIQRALPTAKFVYDMHEDYLLNIRHAGYYPAWLRGWLSQRVRKAELAFALRGHGVIYAEECFAGILPFSEAESAIVRNKYLAPAEVVAAPTFSDPAWPLLLYSGTIAENWGVLRALALWKALQKHGPVRLCIAGHAHDRALLQRIAAEVEASGFADRFFLAGGSRYLPYPEVVGWMQAADLGLGLYKLRRNLRDRIPTKFYEFMAAEKPLLFTANPAWDALNARLGFGMAVEPQPDVAAVAAYLVRLRASEKSPLAGNYTEADYAWQSEVPALLALLKRFSTT